MIELENALFQNGACYLFDCGAPEEFKCVFDSNPGFVSGALDIDRKEFELSRRSKWQVRLEKYVLNIISDKLNKRFSTGSHR